MAIFEQIIHLSDHIATHVVVGFSCSTNSISLPWMYHYNVFAVAVVKVVSKCVNDNWCRTWYCCVRLLLLLLLLFLTLMLLSRAPSLTTAAVEHFKLFFYSISILSLSLYFISHCLSKLFSFSLSFSSDRVSPISLPLSVAVQSKK